MAELQRALEAAQADVEQVAQGREAAEARADELRARLDELQIQFVARGEVIDDAEAIRQAEVARQGRELGPAQGGVAGRVTSSLGLERREMPALSRTQASGVPGTDRGTRMGRSRHPADG